MAAPSSPAPAVGAAAAPTASVAAPSPSPSVRLRTLRAPKEGNTAEQYEDAAAHTPLDGETFTVAVADGASSAIFAREWATLLVDAFGMSEAFPDEDDAFHERVAVLGREWRRVVEAKATSWHAQEKLSSGSSATFQCVTWDRAARTFTARAVGDICLFAVRNDRLKYAFPITKSARFGDRPDLLSTEGSSRPKIIRWTGSWEPGDRFLLMTDAIAAWFLTEWERKRLPWNDLPADEAALPAWLKTRRDSGALKNDDVTIVDLIIAS